MLDLFVIDCLDDYITAHNPETNERHKVGAYQVWVDPAFPDARRAPELRAWMEKKERQAWVRLRQSAIPQARAEVAGRI